MNYPELLLKLIKSKVNMRMPIDMMKTYQQKRLRKMLTYAYRKSPYYHAAFRAAGINSKNIETTPIEFFPTLDKKTLLDRFDSIITVNDIKQYEMRQFDTYENKDKKTVRGYHIVHSSGSTGDPGYFLYDESAWNEMLIGIIRAALWDMSMPQILSFVKSKPKILYIAAADGRYGGAMAVGDGLDNLGFQTIVLDVQMPITLASAFGVVIGIILCTFTADSIISMLMSHFGIGQFVSKYGTVSSAFAGLAVIILFFAFSFCYSRRICKVPISVLAAEN